MNYSQRKHLERLMDSAAARMPEFDPFGLRLPRTLYGMKIVESPDVPRYTLPAEVMPGVPWPPGFREKFNRWSVEFLGTTNLIPRGTAYVIGGHTAVMRPSDVVKISGLL